MVPSAVSAFRDIGASKKDGILKLHCMATKDYIRLYNEDKYWNLDLKDEFVGQTRSLWTEMTENY